MREREKCDGEIAPRAREAREGPPLPCSHEGAIPQFSFDLGPKSGEGTEEGKERVWSMGWLVGQTERMSHGKREQN